VRGRSTWAISFALAAVLGGSVAGCANFDATSLVRQACTHVDRSLTLYRSAGHATSAQAQATLVAAALAELRAALPLAATAAGQSAQWQALTTTLSESSRVPESDLVNALQQQCADVATGTGPAPPSPSNTSSEVPTLPEPVGR